MRNPHRQVARRNDSEGREHYANEPGWQSGEGGMCMSRPPLSTDKLLFFATGVAVGFRIETPLILPVCASAIRKTNENAMHRISRSVSISIVLFLSACSTVRRPPLLALHPSIHAHIHSTVPRAPLARPLTHALILHSFSFILSTFVSSIYLPVCLFVCLFSPFLHRKTPDLFFLVVSRRETPRRDVL